MRERIGSNCSFRAVVPFEKTVALWGIRASMPTPIPAPIAPRYPMAAAFAPGQSHSLMPSKLSAPMLRPSPNPMPAPLPKESERHLRISETSDWRSSRLMPLWITRIDKPVKDFDLSFHLGALRVGNENPVAGFRQNLQLFE